jgi:restriction system protein
VFAEYHRKRFTAVKLLHLAAAARSVLIRSDLAEVPHEFVSTELQGTGNRPLLILDDADGSLVDRSFAKLAVEQLFQLAPAARLIITSSTEVSFIKAPQINLDAFSYANFENLLLQRIGNGHDPQIVDRLYELANGNPGRLLSLLAELEEKGVTVPDLLRLLNPLVGTGLIDPFGRPLRPTSASFRTIVADVSSINYALLHKLRTEPAAWYQLSPRQFEEVIAEMLSREGYEIELTPMSKDGGKDIYAAHKTKLGHFLYIVECKKYAPDRPVGVGILRQLYGVVQAEKLTAGIVATTSFFTRGAKAFQGQVNRQLSLQDYQALQKWISELTDNRQRSG